MSEPLKFDCIGCGRCCESWMVGPITEGESQQLTEYRRVLSDKYPRLASHEITKTLWTSEGWILTINFPDGRCLFLGDDRLCVIHKEFGFESKPLICRRFPLQAITAEDTLREGMRPLSYGLPSSYRDGTPVDLAAAGLLDIPRLGVLSAHLELDETLRQAFLDQERQLIDTLSEPELTLSELLFRLAGAEPSETPRPLPPAFVGEVVKRLSLLPRLWKRPHTESQFEALLQELYVELEALPSWALDGAALELPENQRHFVMFSLLQLVRMRELLYYPSVRVAVFGLALGALAARGAPDAPASDALFAERFITWGRFFTERKLVSVFPDHETLEGLFEQLL